MMVGKRKFASLVAVSLCCAWLSAEEPKQLELPANPRYALQDSAARLGMGTKTVSSFVQDGDGFLWVGTMDGLYRFDGAGVQKFSRAEGVPSTFVDQLAVAADGKVWATAALQIARFDGIRFVPVPLPRAELKLSDYHQLLAIDSSGNAWIATTSGLLRMSATNPSDFTLFGRADGLPANEVNAVHAGLDGNIYFICGNRVGVLRQGGPPQMFSAEVVSPAERPIAVLLDGAKRIWVRTSAHMLRYDAATQKFIPDDSGIPKANDFGVPSVSRAGEIMLPTVAGLFIHGDSGWRQITRRQGLSGDAVFAAYEDRDGAIWIGYGGRGFERWPGRGAWSGWTASEGLPDDVVWCELRDGGGRLWVGTNNGLGMWDAKQQAWRIWNEKQGLAGSIVRELKLANDGAIWALSYPGGLTRIDSKTLALKRVPLDPPVLRDPSGIAIAPDGAIWIGNSQYLKVLRQNGGKFEFEDINVPDEVKGTTSHPVFAPDGTLWTSGRNGIARFDGKNWLHLSMKDGLRTNTVTEVLPVSRDEIWFKYDEALGLGHMNLTTYKLEHFGSEQGLRGDNVILLGRDRDSRIWVGSDEGVAAIADYKVTNSFTSNDGLIWNDTSSGGFWAEPDGTVLLGTSRGLARFQSTTESPSQAPMRVVLTSISLGGTERLLDRNPAVDYKQRALIARFSALTFGNPSEISCRYRLGGSEPEYTITNLREAHYSSPTAGSYQFEVSCRRGFGTWSAPATFAFAIRPPWWERWWARVGEAATLVLLFWTIVRLRTRALERDRRRLEEAVALRSAELAKANRELEQAALTDPLTNVRNRRFFQSTIESDVRQAVRAYSDAAHSTDHRDLIIYLVDIDHFKELNDRFGHGAGDRALVQTAERLGRVVRASDMLIRWGGEEFLIATRSAERKDAHVLAERILAVMVAEPLHLDNEHSLNRTCSVGWAAFPWHRSSPEKLTFEEVLALVDRALYIAKNSGRNQAVGLVAMEDEELEDSAGEMIKIEQQTALLIRHQGPSFASARAAAATKPT